MAYKLFWRSNTDMDRAGFGTAVCIGAARRCSLFLPQIGGTLPEHALAAVETAFTARRSGAEKFPRLFSLLFTGRRWALAAAAGITWRPRRSRNGGGAAQGGINGAAFETKATPCRFRHGVARTAFAADLWNIASGGIGAVVAEAAWMARQIARRSRTVFAVPLRDAVGGIAVGIAETA